MAEGTYSRSSAAGELRNSFVNAKLHVVAVVALAIGGHLVVAAHQRSQRGGDRRHVHVQVGRLVAIDVHANLGLARLRTSESRSVTPGTFAQLRLRAAVAYLSSCCEIRSLQEELQIAVDAGALEMTDGSCTPMVRSRYFFSCLARHGHELALALLALARWASIPTTIEPRSTCFCDVRADGGQHVSDAGQLLQLRFQLLHHLVGAFSDEPGGMRTVTSNSL